MTQGRMYLLKDKIESESLFIVTRSPVQCTIREKMHQSMY